MSIKSYALVVNSGGTPTEVLRQAPGSPCHHFQRAAGAQGFPLTRHGYLLGAFCRVLMHETGGRTMKKGIQSIEHGYLLLEALLQAGEPLPMGRLAALAGMSTSKARAYLISLMSTGLVTQCGDSEPYDLGPSAIRLGMEALRRIDAMQVARRIMAELDETTRLPVVLTMWNGDHAIIVAQNESLKNFPVDFRIGRPISALTWTAAGRIFLAYLPRDWTEPLMQRELAENHLHEDTRHITPAFIARQIKQIRSRGYSVVDGLRLSSGIFLDGYSGLAVPVIDPIQRHCLAVSVIFDRGSQADAREMLLAAVQRAASHALPPKPLEEGWL